jgi:hypothetical protein
VAIWQAIVTVEKKHQTRSQNCKDGATRLESCAVASLSPDTADEVVAGAEEGASLRSEN